MKPRNASIIIILTLIILSYPLYLFINTKSNEETNSGIIIIKSNLNNYKVIPKDKGGIKTPCLEILECESK